MNVLSRDDVRSVLGLDCLVDALADASRGWNGSGVAGRDAAKVARLVDELARPTS